MNNYEAVAKEILEKVGGQKNVKHVVHCSTRLRLTLSDDSKVKIEELEKIKGIMKVVMKGGQCQVVIGNDVIEVYDAFLKLGSFEQGGQVPDDTESLTKEKKKIFDIVIDFLIAIFQPLIPVVAGSGMLQVILQLLEMTGRVDTASGIFIIISGIADAALYFMPMMVAYTTAAKLKCDRMVAVALSALPFLASISEALETGLSVVGIQAANVDYGSQIFPAVLTVIFLALVEKPLMKYCPKPVRAIFVPMLEMLIVAPVSLVVLGPVGYYAGEIFTSALMVLYNKVGWLAVAILAAALPYMTAMGMHKALIPYVASAYVNPGFEMLNAPAKTAHNIAESGACFAVALRSKDPDIRSTALSAGVSALFGISEPALYGVTLQNKRVMASVTIASCLAGLQMGIFAVKSVTYMPSCIVGMPQYIDPANSMNFVWAIVGFIIAIAGSFLMVLFTYRDENTSKSSEEKK